MLVDSVGLRRDQEFREKFEGKRNEMDGVLGHLCDLNI